MSNTNPQEFNLPDVGEGLTEADIVSWAVKPGDTVSLNQVICEIETAKSLVELPSPFEGVVTELLAEPGQTVPVGAPIMRVSAEGSQVADQQPDTAKTVLDATEPAPQEAAEDDNSGAVLVGYGTGGPVKSRRKQGGQPLITDVAPSASTVDRVHEAGRVVAKPPVRKLAKDRGIDLASVCATGVSGEVLREDVLNHGSSPVAATPTAQPRSDSDEPREIRIPVKGVRKLTAQAMVESKFSAPHVSVFTDVDATRTMEFVKRLKASPDFEGIRVSPLLIMAKAMIWASKRNPGINATWTDDEIIQYNYVNLGIAAATPRGLVVPNIKDAQEMTLRELAEAINVLTVRAREGVTQPAEMANGTISITNIGVFGVDTGTPILNRGEVAIMALGQITQKPWVVDGEVRPRWVTTVGGSFDHRVLDGDVMSRFVADVAAVLEEPALLLD